MKLLLSTAELLDAHARLNLPLSPCFFRLSRMHAHLHTLNLFYLSLSLSLSLTHTHTHSHAPVTYSFSRHESRSKKIKIKIVERRRRISCNDVRRRQSSELAEAGMVPKIFAAPLSLSLSHSLSHTLFLSPDATFHSIMFHSESYGCIKMLHF